MKMSQFMFTSCVKYMRYAQATEKACRHNNSTKTD